jgi:hypothetical protein
MKQLEQIYRAWLRVEGGEKTLFFDYANPSFRPAT